MAEPSEDKYFMQQYAEELNRLKYQHDTLTNHIGKLCLAPVDFLKRPLRILDSGTADGLWLRSLQQSLPPSSPEHEFIGTDIVEAYFGPTSSLPKNLSLHIQSIKNPWPSAWQSTFDYVHQRSVLVGAGSREALEDCAARLVPLLKPGGWLELLEADLTEDGVADGRETHDGGKAEASYGPAVGDFLRLLRGILDGPAGVRHDYSVPMREWLEKAGLENIRQERLWIPFGRACPDAESKRISTISLRMTVEGLVKMVSSIPGSPFGSEDIQDLPQRVEKELGERGALLKWIGVWGQKRLPELAT